MSGFNSHDFTNASVETDSYNNRVTSWGVSGVGMLFTAYYSAPNTLTLQFSSYDPAFLAAASSTAANYTIAGSSPPTVTSLTFSPGGRTVTLNLSGPLTLTNTYTLAIADWTVNNGEQSNFSGLIVDVILPTTFPVVGVGIAQAVALGTPNINTAGAMVAVGIEQDIALGSPVVTTLVADTSVGIAQAVTLGTPVSGLFATATGVGIAQPIALGTPAVAQQQEPVGVGFVQAIAVGTPVADINPLTPTGVGIQQNIGLGNPVAAGSGNAHGVGISQVIALGTPVVTQPVQNTVGVGIEQDILLGTPAMDNIVHMLQTGIAQVIALGTPSIISHRYLLITTSQAAGFPDLDFYLNEAFGYGTTQDGTNNIIAPIQGYLNKLTQEQQRLTRVVFEEAAAAFLAACNLPGILPDTDDSDTVTLAPENPPETNPVLTFTDGFLTAYVPGEPIIIG